MTAGAIHTLAGKIKVEQSNFRASTGSGGGGVRKPIYSEYTSSVMVNARKNWWTSPTVNALSNTHGVNTTQQLGAPQVPPPDPCLRGDAAGRNACEPPTATPTYIPSTGLDFTGQHSGLKAVIFWAIFNESSSDNFDSGSAVDNFDLGNPRFSSFLFDSPYCSLGSVPGDNGAESPFQTSWGDWYIRHCPHDYRYMVAQTMFNGFLNYERRFGINRVFEYAEQNFAGSIGNTSYDLWLNPACQSNAYGATYTQARSTSSQSTAYANAIGWLNEYMLCLADLSSSDYTPVRIKRAYESTVWPQINASASDFASLPADPTDGAFSTLMANFGNGSLGVCVGGCTLQCTGAVIYEYEASHGTYVCFATPTANITQSQVNTAYTTHTQQISSYIPNYNSVAQPLLRIHRDEITGSILGYIWHSAVYQQSLNMVHVPR